MTAAVSLDQINVIEDFVAEMQPGSAMFLQDVSWDEYESYLQQIEGKMRVRLSYDEGRLEIMSLSPEHERIGGLFPLIIYVLASECGKKYLSLRSTTMRKRKRAKGLEPDDCYYFNNLAAVAHIKRMDLSVTPPPDLALEIDITSPSLSKAPIYAAIGVAELWRHTGKRMHFFRLEVDGYVEIEHSDLFPFLTPEAVQSALQQGALTDAITMAEQFRNWVQAHKS
ncbi:MAG: Uma2 family endonuclease [Acidobacteria bacterium]|nr:Uma2 family endonuclease [Acidobacteriota bacterium]